MVKQKEFIKKASRGAIKDYYSASKLLIKNNEKSHGILPNFNRDKALAVIREDYAVQTSISKLVDKTLENGYSFYADDGKSNNSSFEELVVKKNRFKKLLREWLYQLYGFQNCFIEIVRDGNDNFKELHTLETTTTEPITDIHGTIEGYIQVLPHEEKDVLPKWLPEEVTHLKLNYLTTDVWSDIEIKSIYSSVLIKKYIMAYFGWKYGTNQLRPLYLLKEAQEDDVKDFLSFWKSTQNDITIPLVFDGEIETIMMSQATEESSLLSVIASMDENIYSMFHVPPIASNENGNSNRSSADKQEQMMAVRIKAVQDVITEGLKYDLFPKIGFNKMNIKFKPIIKTDIGKIMEVAERMKTIGIKTSLIEKYLKDEGFYNEKEIFDKEKLKLEKEGLQNQNSPKKSEDMFPSRQRKPADETSKQIGTGINSTSREDQFVSKAWGGITFSNIDEEEGKFSKYPYTL